MSMSREQMLAKADEKLFGEVAVPEWGDTVRVTAMTAGQRFKIAQLNGEGKIDGNSMMIVYCAVDDSGARLYPQAQDVDVVSGMPAGIVERIAQKIADLSGLNDEAAADAEGNSASTPSDASSSA